MTFIRNILAPIISWLFVTGLVGWIGFLIYRKAKDKLPSRYSTKYKIFKRPYPEEIVAYLLENKDKDEQTMINDLIFEKKLEINQVKEYFWINQEMQKRLVKLKGGIK